MEKVTLLQEEYYTCKDKDDFDEACRDYSLRNKFDIKWLISSIRSDVPTKYPCLIKFEYETTSCRDYLDLEVIYEEDIRELYEMCNTLLNG